MSDHKERLRMVRDIVEHGAEQASAILGTYEALAREAESAK